MPSDLNEETGRRCMTLRTPTGVGNNKPFFILWAAKATMIDRFQPKGDDGKSMVGTQDYGERRPK